MPTRRRFVGLAAASAAVALPLKSQTPAARPAMQLGLIVSAGTDPEAAIRKVHSFGIPTCQVGIGAFDPGMPARLRAALDHSKMEATSLVVPVKDLLAQLEKSGDRRAHGFQIAAAFRHQSCDWLFVPGDDDFFALGNPFKELTKPGLGFQCSDTFHKICLY